MRGPGPDESGPLPRMSSSRLSGDDWPNRLGGGGAAAGIIGGGGGTAPICGWIIGGGGAAGGETARNDGGVPGRAGALRAGIGPESLNRNSDGGGATAGAGP